MVLWHDWWLRLSESLSPSGVTAMTSGCTKHVLGCTKAVACFAEYGCLKSWRCNLITPEESSWGSFSWASLMHWLLRLKSCYLHGTMCSFFRRERERESLENHCPHCLHQCSKYTKYTVQQDVFHSHPRWAAAKTGTLPNSWCASQHPEASGGT